MRSHEHRLINYHQWSQQETYITGEGGGRNNVISEAGVNAGVGTMGAQRHPFDSNENKAKTYNVGATSVCVV